MRSAVAGFVLAVVMTSGQVPAPAGVRLGERSWVDAERTLSSDSVIVIPIATALQQHGPHLPLHTDLLLAEHLAAGLAAVSSVVVIPPVTYHFSPASSDYPGSTTLMLDAARDVTVQVARGLARSGPRRFYAVPVGLGGMEAVSAAAQVLARDGILLRALDYGGEVNRLAAGWKGGPEGGHADELETSMMLHVDRSAVDMKQAVREFAPWRGPLTRQRDAAGTYSASGVWGDATLATREKGQYLVDGLTAVMLREVERLRLTAPPAAQATSRVPPERLPQAPRTIGPTRVFECPPGVERDIKRLEGAFNLHWTNRDAENLALLWADQGDMVHPDGHIEKTRRSIYQHRYEQFNAPEFKGARHSLAFGIIRCINAATAVVDARWSLRDVTNASGATLPTSEGAATLVLQRAGDDWPIEAYRYHVKPGAPPAPVWQKRPGLPDNR